MAKMAYLFLGGLNSNWEFVMDTRHLKTNPRTPLVIFEICQKYQHAFAMFRCLMGPLVA